MLLRRLKYHQTTGLILRRTFPELYKSHLVKLFEEFPGVRSWYREINKEMVFPNGSRLFFGSAEHEKDMDNFYSAEFADILVDEAQDFSENELIKLAGSNRSTSNPDITPKMVFTFMPGVGKGLSYLKRVFINCELQLEEERQKWAFVQAFSWDNIEWARKELARDGVSEEMFYALTDEQRRDYFLTRTEYGANLSAITDDYLRDAWLYGKWDTFEGQVFPELKDELHNLDNFADGAWRPQHARYISAVDWADSGITGAEQSAIDPEENLFFIGEYHERNRTVIEHSADIISLLNGFGRQDYTLMDLPTTAINQDNLFSIQDAFRRAGLHTIQAHRANVAIGLDLLKQMLKPDPNRVHPFTHELGSPRLFISRRRCRALWKQMSELQRVVDPDTGKVKYIGEDDNLDPARYIAMSRPKAPVRPPGPARELPPFTFEQKAVKAFNKWEKGFGKEPNENEWFPKP